ncbi:DUF2735 domain-containing protein [Mangrovicella endophytica]|uniref:DUF2735 domain-containing protein n=1 Tax=Mangrovicella endophytica TaxID=2066697 RepID=UPI000C9E434A|nr:DUF2735 domain-containing protein [Mangrovicella endophytica]
MATPNEHQTATILQFPLKAKAFEPRQWDRRGRAERPAIAIVESAAGAWYHDEAIRDAAPKRDA